MTTALDILGVIVFAAVLLGAIRSVLLLAREWNDYQRAIGYDYGLTVGYKRGKADGELLSEAQHYAGIVGQLPDACDSARFAEVLLNGGLREGLHEGAFPVGGVVMTADVYVFPGSAKPSLPLLPERRKLLLDWLAVLETCGYVVVPEEVHDVVMDICANPDLTTEQRAEFYDGVLTWVDLREGLNERRVLPEAILGCQDQEHAEKTASANAEDAKSLFVHGNKPARGSRNHTPRGNAS